MKSARILDEAKKIELNARDIAQINVLQKVIRDGNRPKHNNLVDTIDYALTAHRIAVE